MFCCFNCKTTEDMIYSIIHLFGFSHRSYPLSPTSPPKSLSKQQRAGAETIKHGCAQDGWGPLQQHAVLVGRWAPCAFLPDAGAEGCLRLRAATLHLPGPTHRAMFPHPAGPLPQYALIQLDRSHREGHIWLPHRLRSIEGARIKKENYKNRLIWFLKSTLALRTNECWFTGKTALRKSLESSDWKEFWQQIVVEIRENQNSTASPCQITKFSTITRQPELCYQDYWSKYHDPQFKWCTWAG